MADLLLGIDIGTTTVKSAAFDAEGRAVVSHAAAYSSRRDGAVVEQDPEDWLRQIEAVLAIVPADRIAAVGITSQVNTHVFVDRTGRALAPAIVWQDVRAGAQAQALDARISAENRQAWFGAPMGVDASHALARMTWMAETRSDVWDETAHVLLPKDFAIRRLTGALGSDPVSNIALAGQGGVYPEGLLALVPGAAERLPRLEDPTAVAGEMEIGGRRVPVARGLMDAWAGMLGTGVHREGDALWQSGTSEILALVSSNVVGAPGILVFPPWAERTVHAGPTQSGGASVDWFCRAMGTEPEALSVGPRGKGVPLFLPHLAGERAPLWDPAARGAFLGIGAETGREELTRAVFEGVALSARLVLERLDVSGGRRADPLLCSGGGFQHDAWAQIRADVTGRTLHRLAQRDPGPLGAAAIAAVAVGRAASLGDALQGLVHYDRTFTPDPALRGLYDDLFALYRPSYEALKPTHAGLGRL